MVENINIQKISFPTPSAKRVTALEQKQGQMHHRRFKRHLEEEEDEDRKNKKEAWQQHDNEEHNINPVKGRKAGSEDQQGLMQKKTTDEDRKLKLIDIVV